jgi:hypothetical protein
LIAVIGIGAAEPPPIQPSPPPPEHRPPALQRLPREPGVWERIQDPLDRSTGRITDEQTYQLDQYRRLREEQLGIVRPHREFERFQDERERRLRIEERNSQFQRMTDRQRREEADRREYELFINAGFSPAASQAFADEQALNQAKNRRDEQLLAAQNAQAEALRLRPGDRQQIDAEYQRKAAEIRAAYEKERERILGFGDSTSTTQPTMIQP